MPVSVEFMRGLIGFIAIGCAYMTARTLAGVRKGTHKLSRLYGWIFRLILCLVAVAFRHTVDAADIAIWGLCAIALAGGYWDASRPKKQEDLTKQIFPE